MFFDRLLKLQTLKFRLLGSTSFAQVYSAERLPLRKFRKEGASLTPLIAGLLAACGGGGGGVVPVGGGVDPRFTEVDKANVIVGNGLVEGATVYVEDDNAPNGLRLLGTTDENGSLEISGRDFGKKITVKLAGSFNIAAGEKYADDSDLEFIANGPEANGQNVVVSIIHTLILELEEEGDLTTAQAIEKIFGSDSGVTEQNLNNPSNFIAPQGASNAPAKTSAGVNRDISEVSAKLTKLLEHDDVTIEKLLTLVTGTAATTGANPTAAIAAKTIIDLDLTNAEVQASLGIDATEAASIQAAITHTITEERKVSEGAPTANPMPESEGGASSTVLEDTPLVIDGDDFGFRDITDNSPTFSKLTITGITFVDDVDDKGTIETGDDEAHAPGEGMPPHTGGALVFVPTVGESVTVTIGSPFDIPLKADGSVDGHFVFRPSADHQFGKVTITYTVTDEDSIVSSEATLEYRIVSVNDKPTDIEMTGDRNATNANSDVVRYVLANGEVTLIDGTSAGALSADDIEDGPLSASTPKVDGEAFFAVDESKGDGDLFTINAAGNLVLKDGAAAKDAGYIYSVTIKVTDSDGGSDDKTFEIVQSGIYIETAATDTDAVRHYSGHTNAKNDGLLKENEVATGVEGAADDNDPATPTTSVTTPGTTTPATTKTTLANHIIYLDGDNDYAVTIAAPGTTLDPQHIVIGTINSDGDGVVDGDGITVDADGNVVVADLTSAFVTALDADILFNIVASSQTITIDSSTSYDVYLTYSAADNGWILSYSPSAPDADIYFQLSTTVGGGLDTHVNSIIPSHVTVDTTAGTITIASSFTVSLASLLVTNGDLPFSRKFDVTGKTFDPADVPTAVVTTIAEVVTPGETTYTNFGIGGAAGDAILIGTLGVEGITGELTFTLEDSGKSADFFIAKDNAGVSKLYYIGKKSSGDYEDAAARALELQITYEVTGTHDANGDSNVDSNDDTAFTGQANVLRDGATAGDTFSYSGGGITVGGYNVAVAAVAGAAEATASKDIGGITFTAVAAGAAGNAISVTFTADSNLDAAVGAGKIGLAIAGDAITITYGSGATLANLIAALEDSSKDGQSEIIAKVSVALVSGTADTTVIAGVTETNLEGGVTEIEAVPAVAATRSIEIAAGTIYDGDSGTAISFAAQTIDTAVFGAGQVIINADGTASVIAMGAAVPANAYVIGEVTAYESQHDVSVTQTDGSAYNFATSIDLTKEGAGREASFNLAADVILPGSNQVTINANTVVEIAGHEAGFLITSVTNDDNVLTGDEIRFVTQLPDTNDFVVLAKIPASEEIFTAHLVSATAASDALIYQYGSTDFVVVHNMRISASNSLPDGETVEIVFAFDPSLTGSGASFADSKTGTVNTITITVGAATTVQAVIDAWTETTSVPVATLLTIHPVDGGDAGFPDSQAALDAASGTIRALTSGDNFKILIAAGTVTDGTNSIVIPIDAAISLAAAPTANGFIILYTDDDTYEDGDFEFVTALPDIATRDYVVLRAVEVNAGVVSLAAAETGRNVDVAAKDAGVAHTATQATGDTVTNGKAAYNQEAKTESYTVNLKNVDDNAPEFTGDLAGTEDYRGDFVENTTGVVLTAQARDLDGGTITYTLDGGTDSADGEYNVAGNIRIHKTTGEVTFITSPNHEGTSQYSFTIVATVGGEGHPDGDAADSVEKTVVIDITDAIDAPVGPMSLSDGGIIEPTAFAERGDGDFIVASINFSDEDTDPAFNVYSYEITGTDAALFKVVDGKLVFTGTEITPSQEFSINIAVTGEGGGTVNSDFTIKVNSITLTRDDNDPATPLVDNDDTARKTDDDNPAIAENANGDSTDGGTPINLGKISDEAGNTYTSVAEDGYEINGDNELIFTGTNIGDYEDKNADGEHEGVKITLQRVVDGKTLNNFNGIKELETNGSVPAHLVLAGDKTELTTTEIAASTTALTTQGVYSLTVTAGGNPVVITFTTDHPQELSAVASLAVGGRPVGARFDAATSVLTVGFATGGATSVQQIIDAINALDGFSGAATTGDASAGITAYAGNSGFVATTPPVVETTVAAETTLKVASGVLYVEGDSADPGDAPIEIKFDGKDFTISGSESGQIILLRDGTLLVHSDTASAAAATATFGGDLTVTARDDGTAGNKISIALVADSTLDGETGTDQVTITHSKSDDGGDVFVIRFGANATFFNLDDLLGDAFLETSGDYILEQLVSISGSGPLTATAATVLTGGVFSASDEDHIVLGDYARDADDGTIEVTLPAGSSKVVSSTDDPIVLGTEFVEVEYIINLNNIDDTAPEVAFTAGEGFTASTADVSLDPDGAANVYSAADHLVISGVEENTGTDKVLFALTAIDPDGDHNNDDTDNGLTFELTGKDAARFTFENGELKFRDGEANFEETTDGHFFVTVTVTEDDLPPHGPPSSATTNEIAAEEAKIRDLHTTTRHIAIQLTDAPEAPTAIAFVRAENFDTNNAVGSVNVIDEDADGNSYVYSLTDEDGNAISDAAFPFEIDAATGAITFKSGATRLENGQSYESFYITVKDGDLPAARSVEITVTQGTVTLIAGPEVSYSNYSDVNGDGLLRENTDGNDPSNRAFVGIVSSDHSALTGDTNGFELTSHTFTAVGGSFNIESLRGVSNKGKFIVVDSATGAITATDTIAEGQFVLAQVDTADIPGFSFKASFIGDDNLVSGEQTIKNLFFTGTDSGDYEDGASDKGQAQSKEIVFAGGNVKAGEAPSADVEMDSATTSSVATFGAVDGFSIVGIESARGYIWVPADNLGSVGVLDRDTRKIGFNSDAGGVYVLAYINGVDDTLLESLAGVALNGIRYTHDAGKLILSGNSVGQTANTSDVSKAVAGHAGKWIVLNAAHSDFSFVADADLTNAALAKRYGDGTVIIGKLNSDATGLEEGIRGLSFNHASGSEAVVLKDRAEIFVRTDHMPNAGKFVVAYDADGDSEFEALRFIDGDADSAVGGRDGNGVIIGKIDSTGLALESSITGLTIDGDGKITLAGGTAIETSTDSEPYTVRLGDVNEAPTLTPDTDGVADDGTTVVDLAIKEAGDADDDDADEIILLTTDHLKVTDVDDDDQRADGTAADTMVFTVAAGTYGVMVEELSTVTGEWNPSDGSFTLGQLRADQVRVRHNGDEGNEEADGFSTGVTKPVQLVVTVADPRGLESGEESLVFTVTDYNDAPTLDASATVGDVATFENNQANLKDTLTALEVGDQTTAGVSRDRHLALGDADNTDGEVFLKLTGLPEHGALYIEETPGVWTKVELNKVFSYSFVALSTETGKLIYIHDGSEAKSDEAVFEAFNTVGNTVAGDVIEHTRLVDIKVGFTITGVNDAPTITPATTPGTKVDWEGVEKKLADGELTPIEIDASRVGDRDVGQADLSEGEGNVYNLNTGDLGVYDPDYTVATEIVYHLVTLPGSGVTLQYQTSKDVWKEVLMSGTAGSDEVVKPTFTLADVISGNLRLIHNGDDPTKDANTPDTTFTYWVTDRDNPAKAEDGNASSASNTLTFNVNVRPVNDKPSLIELSAARISPDYGVRPGSANQLTTTTPYIVGRLTTTDEENAPTGADADQLDGATHKFTYRVVTSEADLVGTNFKLTGDEAYFDISNDNPRDLVIKSLTELGNLGLKPKAAGSSDNTYVIYIEVTDTGFLGGSGDQGPQKTIIAFSLPVRSFDVDWGHTTTDIDQAQTDLEYDFAAQADGAALEVGSFRIRTDNYHVNDEITVRLGVDGEEHDANDLLSEVDISQTSRTASNGETYMLITISITPDHSSQWFKNIAGGERELVNFNLEITYEPRGSSQAEGFSRSVESFSVTFIGENDAPGKPDVAIDANAGVDTAAGDWDFSDDDGDFLDRLSVRKTTEANPDVGFTRTTLKFGLDTDGTLANDGSAGHTTHAFKGVYGTLTIMRVGGAAGESGGTWTYVRDDAKAVPLEGAEEKFEIIASDSKGGVSEPLEIVISLRGHNDAPIFQMNTSTDVLTPADSIDLAVSLTEHVDSGENHNDISVEADQTVTGQWLNDVDAADVDDGAQLRLFIGSVDIGQIGSGQPAREYEGAFGKITFNANGTWTYALNARAEKIAHDETPTEVFRITLVDEYGLASAPITLTITVKGTNDAPTAMTGNTGTVVESGYRTDKITADDNAVGEGDETTQAHTPGLPSNNGDTTTETIDERGAAIEDSRDVAGTISVTGTLDATDVDRIDSDGQSFAADEHSFRLLGRDTGGDTATTTDTDVDITSVEDTVTGGDEGQRIKTRTTEDVIYSQEGEFGTLTVNKYTGAWVYTLNNQDAETKALDGVDAASDEFRILVTDEEGLTTTQLLTVTVTGTEDAPIITGIASTEDNNNGSSNRLNVVARETGVRGGDTAEGRITFSDDDGDDTEIGGTRSGGSSNGLVAQGKSSAAGRVAGAESTYAMPDDWQSGGDTNLNRGTEIQGQYGVLRLSSDGRWKYQLSDSATHVQALNHDQTVTDVFTLRIMDDGGIYSNEVELTIDITGSNDAPTVDAVVQLTDSSLTDTEADDIASDSGLDDINGTFTGDDVDQENNNDNLVWSVSLVANNDGNVVNANTGGNFTHRISHTLGTFHYDESTGEYTFAPTATAINKLSEGDVVRLVFSVKATDMRGADSNTRDITIIITGANDAPTLTSSSGLTAIEDNTGHIAERDGGVLRFNDRDGNDQTDDNSLSIYAKAAAVADHSVRGTVEGAVDGTANIGSQTANLAEDGTVLVLNGKYGVFRLTRADGNGDGEGSVTWTYQLAGATAGGVITAAMVEAVQALDNTKTVYDSFGVYVRDDGSPALSSDVQVHTITITGTNDAPTITPQATAANSAREVQMGRELDFAVTDFNDSFNDLDEHTFQGIRLVSVTSGLMLSGAAATASNTVLTAAEIASLSFDTTGYSLDATTSFTYRVVDSAGDVSEIYTYFLKVINNPPTEEGGHDTSVDLDGIRPNVAIVGDKTIATFVLTDLDGHSDITETPEFTATHSVDGDVSASFELGTPVTGGDETGAIGTKTWGIIAKSGASLAVGSYTIIVEVDGTSLTQSYMFTVAAEKLPNPTFDASAPGARFTAGSNEYVTISEDSRVNGGDPVRTVTKFNRGGEDASSTLTLTVQAYNGDTPVGEIFTIPLDESTDNTSPFFVATTAGNGQQSIVIDRNFKLDYEAITKYVFTLTASKPTFADGVEEFEVRIIDADDEDPELAITSDTLTIVPGDYTTDVDTGITFVVSDADVLSTSLTASASGDANYKVVADSTVTNGFKIVVDGSSGGATVGSTEVTLTITISDGTNTVDDIEISFTPTAEEMPISSITFNGENGATSLFGEISFTEDNGSGEILITRFTTDGNREEWSLTDNGGGRFRIDDSGNVYYSGSRDADTEAVSTSFTVFVDNQHGGTPTAGISQRYTFNLVDTDDNMPSLRYETEATAPVLHAGDHASNSADRDTGISVIVVDPDTSNALDLGAIVPGDGVMRGDNIITLHAAQREYFKLVRDSSHTETGEAKFKLVLKAGAELPHDFAFDQVFFFSTASAVGGQLFTNTLTPASIQGYLNIVNSSDTTGKPTITHTSTDNVLNEGDTLTANTSLIVDPNGIAGDVTYSYQWQKLRLNGDPNAEGDWVDIRAARGGTDPIYTIKALGTNAQREDNTGDRFRVKVTFTDEGDSTETRTSEVFGTAVGSNFATAADAPRFTAGTSDASVDVDENTTAVHSVTAMPPSGLGSGGTIGYRISGTDASLFEVSSSGVVIFKAAPDHENPRDAGGDNIYNITIEAYVVANPPAYGQSAAVTHDLIVNVNDVSDTNADITLTTEPDTISTAVGDTGILITVTDADDTDVTTIKGLSNLNSALSGNDSTLFRLIKTNTQVDDGAEFRLVVNSALTVGTDYTLTVTYGRDTLVLPTITVDAAAPTFVASTITADVNENDAGTVHTIRAESTDSGADITFRIKPGTANPHGVVVRPNGEVSIPSLDFETFGSNKEFSITVEATSTVGSSEAKVDQVITFTLQDANDDPFVTDDVKIDHRVAKASGGDIDVSSYFDDPDASESGSTLVYTIDAAAMSAGFVISGGRISYSGVAIRDNAYTVTVTATDGDGATATQGFMITVTDLRQPDAPAADTAGTLNVNEGAAANVNLGANISAVSGENDPEFEFEIVSGNDEGLFRLSGNQLFTTAMLDFETHGGRHTLSIRAKLLAKDGVHGESEFSVPVSLTINIANLNDEDPVITSLGSQTATIVETDSTQSQIDTGYNFSATDRDNAADNSADITYAVTGISFTPHGSRTSTDIPINNGDPFFTIDLNNGGNLRIASGNELSAGTYRVTVQITGTAGSGTNTRISRGVDVVVMPDTAPTASVSGWGHADTATIGTVGSGDTISASVTVTDVNGGVTGFKYEIRVDGTAVGGEQTAVITTSDDTSATATASTVLGDQTGAITLVVTEVTDGNGTIYTTDLGAHTGPLTAGGLTDPPLIVKSQYTIDSAGLDKTDDDVGATRFILKGGNGMQTIKGGPNGDVFFGGYGNDTFELRKPTDTYSGNTDTVIYRFSVNEDVRADDGADTINGFVLGQDRFVLVDVQQQPTSVQPTLVDNVPLLGDDFGAIASRFAGKIFLNGNPFTGYTGIDFRLDSGYQANGPAGGDPTGPNVSINFAATIDARDLIEAFGGDVSGIAQNIPGAALAYLTNPTTSLWNISEGGVLTTLGLSLVENLFEEEGMEGGLFLLSEMPDIV